MTKREEWQQAVERINNYLAVVFHPTTDIMYVLLLNVDADEENALIVASSDRAKGVSPSSQEGQCILAEIAAKLASVSSTHLAG